MNTPTSAGVATSVQLNRIDRLLSFLKDDPDNASLRADVFEVALQAGHNGLAEEQLNFARSTGLDADAWHMREANLRIAERRYDDAVNVLTTLQEKVGRHPNIAQNLALIASLRNDYETCFSITKDWADVAPVIPVEPGLQAIWLRCLHHKGQMRDAMTWAEQRLQSGTLHSEALGVASLIAIDATQLDKAKAWSEQSLKANPALQEAQLARATVALGERDSSMAQHYTQQILQQHPESGRAWSAQGFAQMLNLDLNAARHSLEQATSLMPSHLGTWHGLGWACLLAKDYIAAQRAFEAALEKDHNFGETHGGLAVIAAMQGQRDIAEEHLRRAFGLDNASMSAQYARALLDGALRDEKSVHRFARQLMAGRHATTKADEV